MKAKTKTLPPFVVDTTKRVSIREYLRNYRTYNEQINHTGEKIIITNQDIEIVAIVPIKTAKKRWTFEDLKKGMFKGGDPNMSNNIDEIVYGI